MSRDWSLEKLYHTVVNARNLDESVAFYKLLGFDVLNDRRNVEWPDFVATIFGMKRAKGRGVLMVLPGDPDGPMIETNSPLSIPRETLFTAVISSAPRT